MGPTGLEPTSEQSTDPIVPPSLVEVNNYHNELLGTRDPLRRRFESTLGLTLFSNGLLTKCLLHHGRLEMIGNH